MRALICAGLFIASLAAGAQPAQTFEQLHEAALKAYQAKNYAEMERDLRQALPLRPNHPRTLYNLAAAAALQGRGDEAIALLEKLERMKLGYKLDEDPDFTALKDNGQFKALAAKFKYHRVPRGSANFAFSGGVPRFIPEGIAYDPDTLSFYLSSVYQRRILRFDRDYNRVPLVEMATNGLWSAMGMTVDATGGRVWVASSALPEMDEFLEEDRGRTGIFAFDRISGSVRNKFLLPRDGQTHAFGDLLLDLKGNLYTTDFAYGALYFLNRVNGEYTQLTAPGALISPQGLTFSKDRKGIFLADDAQGLFYYEIETKKLSKLEAPEDVCLYGIDGLYRYENTLIGIQNGVRPNRVVKILLNPEATAVTGMQVLVSNHPDFDEPTKGVIVRSRFYFIANSQRNRIGPDHRLPPADQLRRPIVLKVNLDD